MYDYWEDKTSYANKPKYAAKFSQTLMFYKFSEF